MRRVTRGILLFALCALTMSCATLFTGTQQTIHVDSEPQGAVIWIDGLEVAETPATLEIEKPAMVKDKRITLRLDGYADRSFVLQKSFNMVSLLNLFTGSIGFIVDILTGAFFEYSQSEYNIKMKPAGDVAYLQDLNRLPNGDYIIPNGDGDLTVIDEESGIALVFSN
ncbi:MAG: hypothetical protein CMH56_06275 [Myxococcales bacterium]|nr:hypothetical protein [Myxococcales bacterium]